MKRTLRGSKNSQIPDESKLNTEQKQQFDKIKGMAKKYENKNEGEILSELKKTVAQGKKDGSMSNEKIDEIARTIAPMLDEKQKAKLNMLMKTLK